MTSAHQRPVDLDLLADYVDGLLDDDRRAEVARLVATDPAWRDTHAALLDALPLVAADLDAYASVPSPMPADVTVALSEALAVEEASRADRDTAPDAAPGTVISLDAARSRRRGRLNRPWLSAAAVILVFVAIIGGVTYGIRDSTSDTHSETAGATSKNAAAANPYVLPNLPGLTVSASGQDYGSALPQTAVPGPNLTGPSRTPGPLGSGVVPQNGAAQFGHDAGTVPPDLDRLLDPGALRACVEAITATAGTEPNAVDFASYEGVAALVARLPSGAIIVVGADCGIAGADEIAHG